MRHGPGAPPPGGLRRPGRLLIFPATGWSIAPGPFASVIRPGRSWGQPSVWGCHPGDRLQPDAMDEMIVPDRGVRKLIYMYGRNRGGLWRSADSYCKGTLPRGRCPGALGDNPFPPQIGWHCVKFPPHGYEQEPAAGATAVRFRAKVALRACSSALPNGPFAFLQRAVLRCTPGARHRGPAPARAHPRDDGPGAGISGCRLDAGPCRQATGRVPSVNPLQ